MIPYKTKRRRKQKRERNQLMKCTRRHGRQPSRRKIMYNNTNKRFLSMILNPNYVPNEEKYAIRFYDNQPDIIEQFTRSKKYIDCHLVSGERNQDVLNGNEHPNKYISEFLKQNPTNTYALFLDHVKSMEHDACVAFSDSDASDLLNWANNVDIHHKYVIFDWDGTLSVVEGMIVPNEDEYALFKSGDIKYQDAAVYFCGSKHRFQLLKNMFKTLKNKGVHVYILTNNPVASNEKIGNDDCSEYSREYFHNISKQIIPGLKDHHILCGYESNGFKPSTFSNNEHLREAYKKMHSWHMRNG